MHKVLLKPAGLFGFFVCLFVCFQWEGRASILGFELKSSKFYFKLGCGVSRVCIVVVVVVVVWQ
jgi:hypothetical protein